MPAPSEPERTTARRPPATSLPTSERRSVPVGTVAAVKALGLGRRERGALAEDVVGDVALGRQTYLIQAQSPITAVGTVFAAADLVASTMRPRSAARAGRIRAT